jgi:hypothetical protein
MRKLSDLGIKMFYRSNRLFSCSPDWITDFYFWVHLSTAADLWWRDLVATRRRDGASTNTLTGNTTRRRPRRAARRRPGRTTRRRIGSDLALAGDSSSFLTTVAHFFDLAWSGFLYGQAFFQRRVQSNRSFKRSDLKLSRSS